MKTEMGQVMKPTFSIIIPVYNAEEYLESCVQSALNQKNCTDLEVILVNDGSRDHSPALCDRLAQQDARVRVIHQQNQGVSVARNTGIDAAEGQYVLFLDSDDLWENDLLETLEGHIRQQPDMIVYGYRQFGCEAALEEFIPVASEQSETGTDYFHRYEKMGMMPAVSCCCHAFRRQFLKDGGMEFPLHVQYGEDFRFCMNCLKLAQKLICVPRSFYHYRVNEASATHTLTLKKIRDLLSACADMYGLFPCAMMADYYCMNVLTLADLSRKDAAQLRDFLRENRYIQRAVSGKKQKHACLLFDLLGWYGAAKAVRLGLKIRYIKK